MKRVYMDLTDENHDRFKQLAKEEKRTLKGLLEYSINKQIEFTLNKNTRKEVKKNVKKGK